MSLQGSLGPPREHLGSTEGLRWIPRGDARTSEGASGSTRGVPSVPVDPQAGTGRSRWGPVGTPRTPADRRGSTVGALCITVQLEDRRGHPWNRRGALGGNRRIPGSGCGATMDPRGGTAGAWIRSLGPVGTTWEHLGSERGTGGSQGGAREHIRSTVGASWIPRGEPGDPKGRPREHVGSSMGSAWHWRGARGCTL